VPSYAAFLRGMNVGGHRISNDELREVFARIGFAAVRTFRASGNVVFYAGAEPAAELAEQIERGLAAELGYAVPAFVRAEAELRAIAALQPFPVEIVSASAGRLQVALLAEAPAAGARRAALALADERDRLVLSGRELYWLPSGGISDSELDLKALTAALGVMTVRTKGTIDLLAARHMAGWGGAALGSRESERGGSRGRAVPEGAQPIQ
jgi:uncharacterized protein (DUF1697 family)